MTQIAVSQPDQRALRFARSLLLAAFASALIAALAGLVLLVADPSSGSSLEGILGITAATAGLAAGGLAIGAAIYAQVKDLWQYAPTWLRVLAWAVIVYAIATAVWSWLN